MQLPQRSGRRGSAAINITPLVDVLLILVVLLMLTLPLQIKKLPVELPRTALGGTPSPQKTLSVAISAEGATLLGVTPTALNDIQEKIVADVTTVELAIDKVVTYERISEVVTGLQSRHPREIVFITR